MFGTFKIEIDYSSLKGQQGKGPVVCCCPSETAERLRCLAQEHNTRQTWPNSNFRSQASSTRYAAHLLETVSITPP